MKLFDTSNDFVCIKMKYGMCMDKNLYIIHMKYVMYNRTEGNKY